MKPLQMNNQRESSNILRKENMDAVFVVAQIINQMDLDTVHAVIHGTHMEASHIIEFFHDTDTN